MYRYNYLFHLVPPRYIASEPLEGMLIRLQRRSAEACRKVPRARMHKMRTRMRSEEIQRTRTHEIMRTRIMKNTRPVLTPADP